MKRFASALRYFPQNLRVHFFELRIAYFKLSLNEFADADPLGLKEGIVISFFPRQEWTRRKGR
jgi:hypothetical protein